MDQIKYRILLKLNIHFFLSYGKGDIKVVHVSLMDLYIQKYYTIWDIERVDRFIGIQDRNGHDIYERDNIECTWGPLDKQKYLSGNIVYHKCGFYMQDENKKLSNIFINPNTDVHISCDNESLMMES